MSRILFAAKQYCLISVHEEIMINFAGSSWTVWWHSNLSANHAGGKN